MSSAGLPGLNGFVGEFTILLGMYLRWPIYAIIACARRYPGSMVFADCLPQNRAGAFDQSRQRFITSERSASERDCDVDATGYSLLLDWSFPQSLLGQDQPIGAAVG